MELERLSGVQLGALVNKGEIKPTEVIEYFQAEEGIVRYFYFRM